MQTSDQIAEMLSAYGVSHFFFVPVILPETVKRMSERGILPVMTHGEKAAAYMADGYARISRKVGVCGAQAIGSTNLAAGLRDAYMARTPIVALSGEPDARTSYRNLYQDVDDHGAFEAVTKWNARVPGPSRFPDLLRQAFRAASSGVPRPVHLGLVGRTGNPGDSPAEGVTRAEPRYGTAPSDRPMAAQLVGRRRRGAARRRPAAGHPGRERRGPLGRGARAGRPGRAAADPRCHDAERPGDDWL